MKFRSITFKLMLFLIVAGLLFSGISNYFNARYLLAKYDEGVHSGNQEILNAVKNDFEGQINIIETTVKQMSIIIEDRFEAEGQFLVPDMDEEELYFDTILRRTLINEAGISNSIYIYFNPELDGETHDVWLYRHGVMLEREEEIPLKRYEENDNMTWFYGPKESRISSWVRPYKNRYQEHVTSYVKPIYYKDTFIGIVGMYLKLDSIKALLSSMNRHENDSFWVYDAYGKIIYHSDYKEGTPVESFFESIEEDYDGQSMALVEGVKEYVYQASLDKGWTFVYTIPVSEVTQSRKRVMVMVISIFLITMFVLILVLWLFTKRYKKMFNKIILGVNEFEKGNLEPYIDVRSNDEIGLMVDAINNSKDSLKKAIESKEYLAFNNVITGLPNRNKLLRRLELIYEEKTRDHLITLIYIDIDNFRAINDLLGYSDGDQFIRLISEVLKQDLLAKTELYHTSIDEFAYLIESEYSKEEQDDFVNGILSRFGKNIDFGQHHFFVTISIGMATRTQMMTQVVDLLRAVDLSVAQAKIKGRNQSVRYNKAMYASLIQLNNLERDFVSAIEKDEFLVYYQPKVSVSMNIVKKMEAIVRWQHPIRGLVLPDEFIHFAEQSGLIIAMGATVLRKVCEQMIRWKEQGEPERIVAVNISIRQMMEENFVPSIIQSVKEAEIGPELIELEITESIFMEEGSLYIKKLEALKSFGFRIALDDFGSGYSSYKTVSDLPIDTLKIDKSLVQDSVESKKHRILLETTIDMAKKLNLEVVAEGVESEEQLKRVVAAGCDIIQGYYYSKPLDAETFIQYCHSLMDDR